MADPDVVKIMADLDTHEDHLNLDDEEAVAAAIIAVAKSRRGIRSWYTSALNQAERAVANAMGPPVVQTQLMADRLMAIQILVDKRYERLNSANQRLFLLDSVPAAALLRQQQIDDTDGRYTEINDFITAALTAVAIPAGDPPLHQPNQGPGAFRAVRDLKPFDLSSEASPTKFSDWMTRFKAYYQASRFHTLEIEAQQSYMQSCIQPGLWVVLKQHLRITTPIYNDDDDEPSCMKFLTREFDQRYPLILRRFALMMYSQERGQTYTDFMAAIKELGAAARLETMTANEYYIFRVITGITDTPLRNEILKVPADRFNMEEIDRVARCFEAAQTCTAAIEAPSHKVSVAAKAFQKPKQKEQKGDKKNDASGLLAREKFKELSRLKLCSRCAKPWHATGTECPHLGSTCNSCQKKGHITPACSKVPWTNKQTSQANKVNQATSEDDDPNDNHCGLVFTGSDFGGL
jgi:hypothetical protein